jgi:GDPmannose 4,6-dehydratase
MKAFITGITGQDGYYLSKLLLNKGYEVHGIVRRNSSINTSRIDPLIAEYSDSKKLNLYYSDLMDSSSLNNLIKKINPDEIYNLAAQSHVAVSFQNPYYSAISANAGIISILEAIKNEEKNIKFYQASSSEMYGGKEKTILNEESVFMPKSPYAASKVFSHNLTQIYRESYDLFGVNLCY